CVRAPPESGSDWVPWMGQRFGGRSSVTSLFGMTIEATKAAACLGIERFFAEQFGHLRRDLLGHELGNLGLLVEHGRRIGREFGERLTRHLEHSVLGARTMAVAAAE